jgi:hypothetical protein
VLRDGEYRSVGRDWKDDRIEYSAYLRSESQFFSWGNIWQRMGIDHLDQDARQCNYDMVLDRIRSGAKLSKEKMAGIDTVRIEAEEKNNRGVKKILNIWHDVSHGYFIVKMEDCQPGSPKDKSIFEISEFMESSGGIVVPIRCRVDIVRNGLVNKSYEVVLSDVQINHPIRLQDSIHGTVGAIGSDWKRIGPTASQSKAVLASEPKEAIIGRPTESEQLSEHKYLLYGSILVFAVCIAILLARRRQNSAKI